MVAVIGVVEALAAVVLVVWLLSLPSDEDEEEIAGMIAGNWDRFDGG